MSLGNQLKEKKEKADKPATVESINFKLSHQEAGVLRGLLVQLMANQVVTEPQRIVDNANNCLAFLALLTPKNTPAQPLP